MKVRKDYIKTEIGKIPNSWQLKPITELLSLIVDNRGKSVPISDSGIPLIATNCIKETALFPIKERLRFLTQETYDTWFRSHPKPNDILFVNKGTPGQVCLVPDPVDFCIAQDMIALRANPDSIDWKYLFAYLRSNSFKKQVDGLNVGTTIPHLKKTLLNKLIIPIPSKPEQELIGDIYYQLSLKIELNLQMNQTLEAMAQAIFKEWFVNFNFPGFDGVLVEGLPKGWRMGRLNEVAKIEIGRTPPRIEPEWFSKSPNDIKWISIKDLGQAGVYIFNTSERLTKEAVKKFRIPIIRENTVVVSFKLTIGRLSITTDKMLSNEAIAQIDSQFSSVYIYLYLNNYNWASLGSTSSIATAINSKMIKDMEVLIPPFDLVEKFSTLINPIFDKIRTNSYENELLTEIRDSLLPKLMTGKIEIKTNI